MDNASAIKQWLKSGHVDASPLDSLESEYSKSESAPSGDPGSAIEIPPDIKHQLRLLAKYVLSDEG